MSQLGSAIRNYSETIHNEHQLLLDKLAGLDAALEALVCNSEVYANLASSADVLSAGRWLSTWLPEHFAGEEQSLAFVAGIGPEWAAFAAEMVRQHREITECVRRFCKVAVELERTADLENSICDLKQTGKNLTTFMAAHLGAEERKLRSLSV